MHNNGLGRHYTIVCADTPDEYSSKVMEFDENLRFSLDSFWWMIMIIVLSYNLIIALPCTWVINAISLATSPSPVDSVLETVVM